MIQKFQFTQNIARLKRSCLVGVHGLLLSGYPSQEHINEAQGTMCICFNACDVHYVAFIARTSKNSDNECPRLQKANLNPHHPERETLVFRKLFTDTLKCEGQIAWMML